MYKNTAIVWTVLAGLALACGGSGSDPDPPPPIDPITAIDDGPQVPDWVGRARIAGADLYHEMTDAELDAVLNERVAENVSVIEVDTRLSEYLTEAQFEQEITFLTRVAERAHAVGLRAVIYYPALEVLTANAMDVPNSMFKDHPDWVQHGIDGSPNVFYGNLEHWVEEGTESAWMSPNSGYRDYFLGRVRQLAGTGLDGVWVDVPVYMETGAVWPGAEPAAAEAFRAWSIAQGLGGPSGYTAPSQEDFTDPAFRAWIRWRHDNLAEFVDDIRLAGMGVNPDFVTVIETFPVDNVDATSAGLDGLFRVSGRNLIHVWEIDSVSNTRAMQYATYEDMNSKISMYKWAKAAERGNPTWAFSYGYQPLDAGLVMAASLAAGVSPFECQTPEMTVTVDSEHRTRWFGFVAQHTDALLGLDRYAETGIWYSSASRDYTDLPVGGNWGMYITVDPPAPDEDWWADGDADGAMPKPHLGGWRGASHALSQLGVPYSVITEPGPLTGLSKLKLLWMPSVTAISDKSAAAIADFVASGGVLFATGELPGTLDELGNPRGTSALADVLGAPAGTTLGSRAHKFGNGIAIYRPDVPAREMYALESDPDDAAYYMSEAERILRLHVPSVLRFPTQPGIHVEVSHASAERHYLYVVNNTGLQLPLVRNPVDLALTYRAPPGYAVQSAEVFSPDTGGFQGATTIRTSGNGLYELGFNVDQFSLVAVDLVPKPTDPPPAYAGPNFPKNSWRDAAQRGLQFILDKMRNPSAPAPHSYGVFTNLKDDTSITEIYAHGHHVTAEHMGLLLRATACMKNKPAYDQAHEYVRDVMWSPLYGVINWAVDKDTRAPLIQPSDFSAGWVNANAPLDDFRVVRGLLAGPSQVGVPSADALADSVLTGLYWTSVTDRDRDQYIDFPEYPKGLVGFAWDWEETDAPTLSPPSIASGTGALSMDPIPIDYQDLYVIGLAAQRDPRWQGVLEEGTDLLLAAEIAQSGLFYNGYKQGGVFTGDFENQDDVQGLHLKTIQVLWIGLHLARAAKLDNLDPTRKAAALAASQRALAFFKSFYTSNNRVPEYLTFAGADVADCGSGAPADCLERGETNLFDGEARIYSLLGRLAVWLDDPVFAATLIDDKIVPDQITTPGDPRFGMIGVSTAATNDAEAWNVLESVLTICIASGGA